MLKLRQPGASGNPLIIRTEDGRTIRTALAKRDDTDNIRNQPHVSLSLRKYGVSQNGYAK
jgi:hypothetical protein